MGKAATIRRKLEAHLKARPGYDDIPGRTRWAQDKDLLEAALQEAEADERGMVLRPWAPVTASEKAKRGRKPGVPQGPERTPEEELARLVRVCEISREKLGGCDTERSWDSRRKTLSSNECAARAYARAQGLADPDFRPVEPNPYRTHVPRPKTGARPRSRAKVAA